MVNYKHITKKFNEFVKESINNIIFYHNSDHVFTEFIKKNNDGKLKRNYIFFSSTKNAFIEAEYTYTVKLTFNSDDIFNTFDFIKNFGIKYTLGSYVEEVKKLLSDNVEYFYDHWEKVGVDSPKEVIEYYIRDGGDEDDRVGLLFYFLRYWNDSWVIVETDIFLNFIESKGYSGFVTMEDGILNLGLKDNFKADIISRENMRD